MVRPQLAEAGRGTTRLPSANRREIYLPPQLEEADSHRLGGVWQRRRQIPARWLAISRENFFSPHGRNIAMVRSTPRQRLCRLRTGIPRIPLFPLIAPAVDLFRPAVAANLPKDAPTLSAPRGFGASALRWNAALGMGAA
ncbi:hypothetical protein CMUS01_05396 [Colletotrichum musicola]|uniref:Uncharacterized protein n=1 Tax=Colletotrichum musicola TaxID=2175873 RepID=A0A8H6KT76_9PEZI|nr:hypothetical protein CMUS01_05396 [Colletotrichum musicola]